MEDIIDIIVTETTNLIEITSQPTDEVIDVNIIDNREDITLNVTPSVVEININSLTGNFGVNWGDINGTLSNQTDLQDALDLKADLVDGKVPSSQLPSYVDDVIEVATYSALPATGEVGKIYVVLDTNLIYRWSGSAYIEIKDSSAVWGAITGTLSSQTDLQSALDAKQNQLNGTGFVKASGTTISYDNSTYLTTSSAASTYVPYTGATNNVNLGNNDVTAGSFTGGTGSFETYGAGNTVGINHSSGAGIALNINKSGSGEGIYVNKTSGSGNAVTIVGTLNATTIVKNGGTSAQFLKADGSVDSTSYQPTLTNPVTGTGTSGIVAKFNGTSSITDSIIYDNGTRVSIGADVTTSNKFTAVASTTSSYAVVAQASGAANGFWATLSGTGEIFRGQTSGGSYFIINNGGNAFLNGNLNVGDFASTSYKLNVVGTANFTGALSGTSATFSGNMTIGEDLTLTNVGTAASNILATSTSGTLSLTAGASSGYTGGGTIELVANDRSGTNTRGEVYISAGNASANTANGFIALQTANTERLRVTYGGNVGIGTTSPAVPLDIQSNSNASAIRIRGRSADDIAEVDFYNYANNSLMARIQADTGYLLFDMGGSERMRITSAGNVGIGTTSPSYGLDLQGSSAASAYFNITRTGYASAFLQPYTNGVYFGSFNAYDLIVATNNTERMRIATDGVLSRSSPAVQTGANADNFHGDVVICVADTGGYNAANTAVKVAKVASTGRSINAAGTINASGADYAEYMLKANESVILKKGDIVGIDINSKLTNNFIDAISFVIKSTDPSYVGGDNWFNEERPQESEDNFDENILLWESKYQEARKLVDRIAFSGQVPCNVLGANVGDYIIPVNENGKIKGIAVSNPTFEQYQISVGKVWKIMEDGRAWVAVKIG